MQYLFTTLVTNCFLVFALFGHLALQAQNTPQLDAWLRQYPQYSEGLSFSLHNAETGAVVCAFRENLPRTPASVQKLVTAARFSEWTDINTLPKTKVLLDGRREGSRFIGNVWVVGAGDPFLGMEENELETRFVSSLADKLRNEGISEVSGYLILHSGFWNEPPAPRGWIYEDLGNYYGAGAWGLSYGNNDLWVEFNTSAAGQPAELTAWQGQEWGIGYTNQVLAAATGGDQAYVLGSSGQYNRSIVGTLPQNRSGYRIRASDPCPPQTLAIELRIALERRGIATSQLTDSLVLWPGIDVPQNGTSFTFDQSPVSNWFERMLRYSDNTVSEHAVRHCASSEPDNSAAELQDWFCSKTDAAGVYLCDGSGLSPQNKLTTKALCQLLVNFKNNANLRNALPEAGKIGSVRSFIAPANAAHIWLKSGYAKGVRSYAGYILLNDGRLFAVSTILNDHSTSPTEQREALFELLSESINAL